MKIVLTGGSGMVGKNIIESDLSKTHILLTPSSAEMNLLDQESTVRYLKRELPDLVIHSAGHVGGIQSNMKNKAQYLFLNMQMGMNLVHACDGIGIPQLLNLGSSCMYPRNILEAIPESKILTGELEPTNEGYAIAKIAVAKFCEYLSIEKENRHYKTIIPCNLYGRWDKFDPIHSHLIPSVIRKLHEAVLTHQETVEIWGTGEARREFMYAGDLAKMVVNLVARFEEIPPYLNIGLGYDYSINEYYQVAAAIIGFKGKFVHDLNRPVGMNRKLVDIELLRKIGIHCDSGLQFGIEKTYEFFKK